MKKIILAVFLVLPFFINAQEFVKVFRFKIETDRLFAVGDTIYFDPSCVALSGFLDTLKSNEVFLYLWIDESAYVLDTETHKAVKAFRQVVCAHDNLIGIDDRHFLGDFTIDLAASPYLKKLIRNAKTYIASDDCSLAIPLLEKVLYMMPSHKEAIELLKTCGK